MSIVSVIVFVGLAVVQLLQIIQTQYLLISSSYKSLNASAPVHNGTNSSIKDTDPLYQIAWNNFGGEVDSNVLDVSHNNRSNNISIQDINTLSENINAMSENALENFDGPTSKNHLTKSDVVQCPNCTCGKTSRKKRITGGIFAELNEFPWKAVLWHNGSFLCAATIITRQHLLTAAHCVKNHTEFNFTISAAKMQVLLGRNNMNMKWYDPAEILVGIKEIIPHPEFDESQTMSSPNKHDIAILKLDTIIPFNMSHIQPACLPKSKNQNYTGLTAVAIGWGLVNSTHYYSDLIKAEIPLMSIEACRKKYNDIPDEITDDMICADNSGGKDTCKGDSGGSGTMEVIGITIWGRGGGCAKLNFPGIYTKIANYVAWVNENIGEDCLCFEQE